MSETKRGEDLEESASRSGATYEKSWFDPWIPPFQKKGLRVDPLSFQAGLESVPTDKPFCITVPGSKSFTNRALVCSGMSAAVTHLEGVLFADDSYWGLECLRLLGFGLEVRQKECSVTVTPPGIPKVPEQNTPLYFGHAGTLARFFPAVLLNLSKTFPAHAAWILDQEFLVSGSPKLCARPLSELVVALRGLGAKWDAQQLPSRIRSSLLQGKTQVDGSTSGQFLSGLLLAAAGSREPISIDRVGGLVQPDYVRMTAQCLSDFGAKVSHDEELRHFEVFAPKPLEAKSGAYTVEADASTACYFLAWAALLGKGITVSNIGSKTLQPDLRFTEFLQRLGVQVVVASTSVTVLESSGRAEKFRLSKDQIPTLFDGGFEADFSAYSDQALTAGVLSVYCDKPIRVTGASHIRHHESDRIASLVSNLKSLGVGFAEFDDGFSSPGGGSRRLTGTWPTHGDHRFAMTGFLLGLSSPDLEILNPECVAKTAPQFFAQMKDLGVLFR